MLGKTFTRNRVAHAEVHRIVCLTRYRLRKPIDNKNGTTHVEHIAVLLYAACSVNMHKCIVSFKYS